MKMKDITSGILKKVVIISIILILSVAIIPTPDSVVRGTTAVDIELEAGWNFIGMPESISASDLTLKSKHITSVVHMDHEGYYKSYIPSLGATDFICEPNEAIYIYSNHDTTITFTISEPAGDISGDLFVTGDTILNKNLTVNGSMSVVGDLEVNSLNVTEDLTVDGDLTVHEDVVVGEDLTVTGSLIVGEDLTVGDLTVTEDMTINDDLDAAGDATIGGDSTVEENMTINGNLSVAGDSTVGGDSTIGGDMEIGNNLSVTGDTIIGGDAIIAGNLTTGDFTVANLTITEDLSIDGNLSVTSDTIIGGDATIVGNLTAGDFTVDNLTITEDLSINGNLSITGDTMIDGDAMILGNLTADDFTADTLTIIEDLTINGNLSVAGDSTIGGDSAVTGDMTIDGNLTVNGTLLADKDVQVDGNLSVIQDTTIGGYLTVTGNATFENDLTVNGNLTVFNLVSNIVSENYVVGNLTVTENVTGLAFSETADYMIFIDRGVVHAKNGATGNIDFQSTDAAYVIQSSIDALPATGGKIFIKAGTYELSSTLRIEHWRDPNDGTILIEGEGFNKNTVLKLTSASDLLTFVSLNGSSHLQFRNLAFEVNKKADYGIRMERDDSGKQAGNHVFENVIVSNAKKVGILIYGSENVHLSNVYATYGNTIGMIVTSKPPVDDPTVINSASVDVSAPSKSTGGTTLVNCKLGHLGTTTKAALIAFGSHLRVFGGYAETMPDAEAVFILDEMVNQNIFDGVWIDAGPNIGFRIGNYPSSGNWPSILTITSLTARAMSGTSIIEAEHLSGSVIEGITTSKSGGKIVLGSTTRRNFIAGFINTPAGEYLTVEDYGIGNNVFQATVTIGNDLTVNGHLSVTGDLSVSGDMAVVGNMVVTGDLIVTGDILGATGRGATIVIASNNASDLIKAQADYVCDGTDDEVTIQTAINNLPAGGGSIEFSAGIYDIDGEMVLVSNLELRGQGASTVFRMHDGNYGHEPFESTDTIRNLYVHDIMFDGNAENMNGQHDRDGWFHIYKAVDTTFERCYFKNCIGNQVILLWDPNFIEYQENIIIRDNWFINCGANEPTDANCMRITGDNVVITGNTFDNGANQVSAMDLNCDNLKVTNNHVKGGRVGIVMSSGFAAPFQQHYNHVISNNIFEDISYKAFEWWIDEYNYSLNAVVISGNTFKNNRFDVNAIRGYDTLIDGNMFYNTTEQPIWLFNMTRVTISNNHIFNSTDEGMEIRNSSDIHISGGIIANSGTDGIEIVNCNRVDISDVTIKNSGQEGINRYGIKVLSTTSNVTITNCRCFDDQTGSETQYRGIHVENSANIDTVIIMNNYCWGNIDEQIHIGSSVNNAIVEDNVGYVTPDNDYIVAPSGSTSYADFYCDGVDDHIQIQQAIDSCSAMGGHVRLLVGTYDIRDKILLKNGIHISGQGKSSTLLVLNAGNSLSNYEGIFVTESPNLSGIKVSDMILDTQNGGIDQKIGGIRVDRSSGKTGFPILGMDVEGIQFNTNRDSLQEALVFRADVLSTTLVRISYCDFNTGSKSGWSGIGLRIKYCDGVIVENCRFDGNDSLTSDGIIVDDSVNILVDGCTFENFTHNGILSRNNNMIRFTNCYFIVEPNGDGIDINYDEDITISGCIFYFPSGGGFSGSVSVEHECNFTTIVGNTMRGNAGTELILILHDSGNTTVTGNTLEYCTMDIINMVDTIIKDNIGFITENFGYSTSIQNDDTVLHGLDITPTIVIIIPTGNVTVWVKAITSTTFTVGLPTGSYDIYWYAIYKP